MGGGGGGNKEQRDFQMETTQEFMFIYSWKQTCKHRYKQLFKAPWNSFFCFTILFCFPLQIYIPPVCVQTGLCSVSSSPGLGLCLTGSAGLGDQQSPCGFYMDTRMEAQVTMLAQKNFTSHNISLALFLFHSKFNPVFLTISSHLLTIKLK